MKLQVSVGADIRDMSELGYQSTVQAEQDLFSLFLILLDVLTSFCCTRGILRTM